MNIFKKILIIFGFIVYLLIVWIGGPLVIAFAIQGMVFSDFISDTIFYWPLFGIYMILILAIPMAIPFFSLKHISNKWPNLQWSKSKLVKAVMIVTPLILWSIILFIAVLPTDPHRSGDTRRVGDMRNIQTAMELCYEDPACGGPSAYITYTDYAVASDDISGGIGSYISGSNMTNDRKPGSSYVWVDNTANSQNFCVYAKLEDKQNNKGIAYASHSGYGLMASGSTNCPQN